VPDHHTVLSEILKHVPHARFKELIKSYNADGGSRRLDSKTQLVALPEFAVDRYMTGGARLAKP
jgi:hypothetical protein